MKLKNGFTAILQCFAIVLTPVLSQILPVLTRKPQLFRWKVEYAQTELAELIKKKSGIDFGNILKLEPVQRGDSARIIRLKIYGTKKP